MTPCTTQCSIFVQLLILYFVVVYLSSRLFLSFVSNNSNSLLSSLFFGQILNHEVLLRECHKQSNAFLQMCESFLSRYFFSLFSQNEQAVLCIMTIPKSAIIFRKDWFKNIISCLKINLSNILEITGKMLVVLKYFLTFTLQETLQQR